MNILIVCDDENIHCFLRATLSEHWYAVEGRANGQEGLDRAREHRPDLVISDGLMFLRMLRSDPGLSRKYSPSMRINRPTMGHWFVQ